MYTFKSYFETVILNQLTYILHIISTYLGGSNVRNGSSKPMKRQPSFVPDIPILKSGFNKNNDNSIRNIKNVGFPKGGSGFINIGHRY